jgi:sigma-B regulation protein RsbU (phosphoserine phosphatase)
MNPFHSLRTQLCAGAVLLLGVTVASISYFLIDYEKTMLRDEIQKAVVLQGRNIALGSEKALLRSDPEFELFPLVKTLMETTPSVESVVITDAEGVIYGHSELQQVSRKYEESLAGFGPAASKALAPKEKLSERDDAFALTTPVASLDRTIGYVHMSYSKDEFNRSIRRAIAITLVLAAVALALGTALSLVLFRRISEPMARLMEGVQRIGAGDLRTKIKLRTRNEFRTLAESFNDMADRIARAQEELVVKERMQKELEIAREIQSTLIPKRIVQPDGYEVAMYYESATEVGGDYIDVIPAGHDRVVFVLADVSGKGVPGMVVMGMLKIMVHTLVARGIGPAELLRELNLTVKKTLKPNMFVTFFIARLNTTTGELVYSNAGHNPLVVYDRDRKKSHLHKMVGPPLGIFPQDAFAKMITEYRLHLEPGMLVLQYTDGVNESANGAGELFGIENVLSVCDACAVQGASALVPSLARAELGFRKGAPQADDIAVLAVGAKVGAGTAAHAEQKRG